MSLAALPPLLVHALFPSFPPLWFILLAGLILGVGLAAFARKRRGPAITTLGATRGAPRSVASAGIRPAAPLGGRLAEIRETLGDEILGVPWSVPGYAFLFVVAGGIASMVIPPLGIALLPGYIALWAVALNSSGSGPSGWVGDVMVVGFLVVGSWIFWTGAAMFGWHLLRIVRNDPAPDRRVRLNLGRRSES